MSLAVLFTFGKEGKLQKNNKKEEKEKGKGTVQVKEHFCLTLTRLSGAKQARGGSQLLAAIIRPGPAKIDVCENLELCKGKAPSVKGFLRLVCRCFAEAAA